MKIRMLQDYNVLRKDQVYDADIIIGHDGVEMYNIPRFNVGIFKYRAEIVNETPDSEELVNKVRHLEAEVVRLKEAVEEQKSIKDRYYRQLLDAKSVGYEDAEVASKKLELVRLIIGM